MEVTVVNRTEFSVNSKIIEDICDWLEGKIEPGYSEISLVFVNDREISRLNEKYYGREGPTDVLAFFYDREAEIFLNPYQHRRQAPEYDNSFSQELVENIVHAFLHLAGYDHTKEDDEEHLQLQKKLMIEFKNWQTGTVIENKNQTGSSGEM